MNFVCRWYWYKNDIVSLPFQGSFINKLIRHHLQKKLPQDKCRSFLYSIPGDNRSHCREILFCLLRRVFHWNKYFSDRYFQKIRSWLILDFVLVFAGWWSWCYRDGFLRIWVRSMFVKHQPTSGTKIPTQQWCNNVSNARFFR